MPTVHAILRPCAPPQAAGVVYFQVSSGRKTRRVSSGIRLLPGEWDARRGAVVVSDNPERHAATTAAREEIRAALRRFARIERLVTHRGDECTAELLVGEYRRYTDRYSVFNYVGMLAGQFERQGRMRTAEAYRAALSSLRRFREGRDLMLDCLSSDVLEAFQAWHLRGGRTLNTVSFYLRVLRAAYRRAVDEGAVDDQHPFRRVYTGVDKTAKRALHVSVLKRLRQLNLDAEPRLAYARDMFMLSFMLRGMSLVDMAYLRLSDLQGGVLTYRRRKTGQQLRIAWTPDMQAIVDRYPAAPEPYLLPIIRRSTGTPRSAYRNAGCAINAALKELGRRIGSPMPLTLYAARHSWASTAHGLGVPVGVISEGMGHSSEATTRIYLAELDATAVDAANSQIISSI